MTPKFNVPSPNAFEKADLAVSQELFDSMWELFIAIGDFWKNGDFRDGDAGDNDTSYQSQLLSFMNNRIELDPVYLNEYEGAKVVIEELQDLYGTEGGYKELFTQPVNPKIQPSTPFERARIKVSNEFVLFQLAMGGFEAFGAKNYPGYFGGANIKGKTPYRTIE